MPARMLAETALPAAEQDGSWTGEGAVLARDGRGVVPVSHVVLAHRGRHGEVESYTGIMRDLSERKRAEEERLLLAREVDHRAKNTLAVVQAALRLTPKADAEAFARVEGRVMALARAHTLLAESRWTGAGLHAVARAELAAFLPAPPAKGPAAAGEGAAPRAELVGPAVTLAPAAAQAFSMALHELATNATKHGALSVPGGRIVLTWEVDRPAGLLRLRWAERGGPTIGTPPARRGFGSRVLEATMRDQLGGAVERRWEPAGLVCEISLPLARVLPEGAG
jgi:two-component sensor histidine kinase